MPSKMTDVATRFVDLTLKYKRWDEVKTLPADEVQVLFDTVSAAGFNPKKVAPGKLVGHYRDQDGSNTGETYPINSLCPFKVVSEEDGDNYFATGWLDCALQRAVYGSSRQNEDREKLIEMMAEEVERSVPLEPIQLTLEGDLLREYPPRTLAFGSEYFVKHTRDENDLGSCVGVHMHCNCWIDRRRATSTHDAIVCRGCHLRVLFPKEVKTYGDLRQVFASQRVKVPA
ncbi:MAG: hypothetical protein UW50_C0001G0128 [Candidatus Wolfebacteria bacterium GW2011_GWA1_44_24]|uniref:Uncharacterized protein n=1 Tax=Candidatus Wolfebacteria bacterium GW2011_GWB1_41_12 TaxID=1619006 RepID=A0A0G0UMQ6_9BACT|nr:MAG: hypothetical protein UU38_C0003G0047 [Candidatus Wolfebacteria bacterium GW2011_GWB1_41_12]KKT56560.1 MAG: hypothetical protein UW50_C0001G0128 [Candidatus Wolfebacteria bacterium GW2011_GWA1_44_24]